MENTRKLLSIILAILMIATTVPFAFAADETPDFSDAKVLTAVSGKLYIDGEVAEKSGSAYDLPAGKYKLTGDISTTVNLFVEGEAVLDLNGYIWDLNDCRIILNAPLSVYDTSTDKTGKITSSQYTTIRANNVTAVFSLYGGIIENTSTGTERYAISATWASANLYGGKIVSNGYAVNCSNSDKIDKTLKLGDVILESGEGYAQINLQLSSYSDTKEMIIDVTDYTGDTLEIDSTIDCLGKVEILKGIKSAEDAEKYKINVEPGYSYLFHEKTGYDEENGTKYVCMARNAFTQQPTIDNNYTVDFSNPAATFQWYEVGENYIGKYIAERFMSLFSYDFKAGDTLKVSTDSDLKLVYLMVGDSFLELGNEKTATVKFDTDGTMTIESTFVDAENPVELEFSVIKETELEGETGKTLHKFECGKSYYCKATVGKYVCVSDAVTIAGRHVITQVDAKAPTCTEIGWDAYEYCTDCTYTTYVEKEALNHDIVIDAYVAPQCTETGLTAGQHCSRCDDMTIVQEVIPDLGGHINEDGNTTCDRCGETILCEDCGRPVHAEEGIPQYMCWLIFIIKMIVSIFK